MIEINQAFVDRVLPQRIPESDKNDYGRVLCVCGSKGYTGAAYFAAQGAVRMGSGIVTLAVPESAWQVLALKLNEAVVRPLPCDAQGILSEEALSALVLLAERADALLVGCGIGQSDDLTRMIPALMRQVKCQIVLDADGINAIGAHKDILRETAKPVILTPHAKEFARLSGIAHPTSEQLADFAKTYRCVLLYKGHRTQIALPDGRIYRNHSGNPGMAKGGSGDVLAGMIVSLCGQNLSAEDAACAAAWLHGRAGNLAANRFSEYSMTPSDLLLMLPEVTRRYNSREW